MTSASVRRRYLSDNTEVFDVRWREGGKSKTKGGFPSEKQANAWAELLRRRGPEEAIRALNEPGSNHDTPTVNKYAETYIASKSGVEPKTLEHYRMYMRESISAAIGDLPITMVTADHVAAWVNKQAQEPRVLKNGKTAGPYSAKTIKNRHGFLSAMFQHAQDRGVIPRNPCAGTRMPNTERQEMTFLSPDEFTTLLEYIPERHKPLVQTLGATGMRWGEVTALRHSDFDLDAQTVRISRAWKSSAERGWYVGAPKTKRSKRTISLPDGIIPVLRDVVRTGSEYVFLNKSGQPIRQQNFYEAVWNPARRLANGLPAYDATRKGKSWEGPRTGGVWDREPAEAPIGKMPRIHDLRHSHASWLISRGAPMTLIQRRMGHESIQTTSDTYGHLSPEDMIVAARMVDQAMAGSLAVIEA